MNNNDLLINSAYRKLKQYIYYENTDLFQRKRLAEFESSSDFSSKLDTVKKVFAMIQDGCDVEDIQLVKTWLESITFHILPKSTTIKDPENHNKLDNEEIQGTFVTNNRTSNHYFIEKVNYFIEAPVELLIFNVIWIMTIGKLLDASLSPDCYGNRLDSSVSDYFDNNGKLFQIYYRQYQKWRDNGITKAQRSIELEKKNLAVFLMDLKQCYYHIEIDFSELNNFIQIARENQIIEQKDGFLYSGLSDLLELIHLKYFSILRRFIAKTHEEIIEQNHFLPIGLPSSGILCNWYLNKFDYEIHERLSPEYYGRYVDDILIVLNVDSNHQNLNSVGDFIEQYLVQNNLMEKEQNHNGTEQSNMEYKIVQSSQLYIQPDKLILHFISKNHSQALLRKVKIEIEKNSSLFRFLPGSDLDKELDDVAYDVIYEGSSNKLRSVIEMSENSTELSKYLAKKIIAHRLSIPKDNNDTFNQLFRFFRGKNYLDFCRLWEKVFSFGIITDSFDDCWRFYSEALTIISKTKHKSILFKGKNHRTQGKSLLRKIQHDLKEYLHISLALPCSLLDQTLKNNNIENEKFLRITNDIWEITQQFRKTNLLRHQFVAYPLANFTSFSGNLLKADSYSNWCNKDLIQQLNTKLVLSPRYIHLHELQLFFFTCCLLEESSDDQNDFNIKALKLHSQLYCQEKYQVQKEKYILSPNLGYSKSHIGEPIPEKKTLKVAVANIQVSEENIRRSYDPHQTPNISYERQQELYNILNFARKEKVELLVLPELSIPYHWLPFMVSHAQHNQIGLIFGMEHIAIKEIAYNFLVTILPFSNHNGYLSSWFNARLKNHYAPKEIERLQEVNLSIPTNLQAHYDLFSWKGVKFSSYNCFELTNINHRTLFLSEVDFLTASVFNRDTTYFSNIIESTSRDLHCFVIQANSSIYGDSRIVQPTGKIKMNILRVTGGTNSTILCDNLDIEELRKFQIQYTTPQEGDKFKPLPPGFDQEKVLSRYL